MCRGSSVLIHWFVWRLTSHPLLPAFICLHYRGPFRWHKRVSEKMRRPQSSLLSGDVRLTRNTTRYQRHGMR